MPKKKKQTNKPSEKLAFIPDNMFLQMALDNMNTSPCWF